MSEPIRFAVYGDPLPKGSVKAFTPKGWTRPILTSATRGLKDWERKIASAANAHADGTLITGAVHLTVAFFLSRPKSLPKRLRLHTKRPDLDKLIRGATDALTGIVYKDDSQIVSVLATKNYTAHDEEAPRAEFSITRAEE